MADFTSFSHDGWTRRHYQTVGSTNDEARHWIRDGAPHLSCVSAGAQTHGHGRRGRDWASPSGRGVYLSAILRPDAVLQSTLAAASLAPITVVAALAAALTAQSVGGMTTRVKWPNDILMRGRKIGGVLCEGEWRNGKLEAVVAGIGLNVNHRPEDLPERPIFPASSLQIESGHDYDIEAVTVALLHEFKRLWQRLEAGEWNAIRADWEARCEGLNGLVSVSNEGSKYFGVLRGLDTDGALLLATADGIQRVLAGDISFEN